MDPATSVFNLVVRRPIGGRRNIQILLDSDDLEQVSKLRLYPQPTDCCTRVKRVLIQRPNRVKTSLAEFLIGRREGLVVDHLNRNPLDFRKKNLLHKTQAENLANRGIPVKQNGFSNFSL